MPTPSATLTLATTMAIQEHSRQTRAPGGSLATRHGAPPQLATLELFGGPRVTAPSGLPVRLTPTQQAFVTLVWGHEDRGVRRQELIRLLWQTEDQSGPRQRLRQLLHEVRTRLGLEADDLGQDERLAAPSATVRSDLPDFRAFLRGGELGRAMALLDRGFGSELKRIPGREFDDWLQAKRVALRRALRSRAADLWDASQPTADWRIAREAAEIMYALDPRADESTLRKVIEARVMTGNPEAAEAVYVAHLDSLENGATVEAATTALLARVRRLSSLGRELTNRAGTRPPPLVGRHADLEAARTMLTRVRGGSFELLLVKGEAGVGKTRLLEEVRCEAHLKGFRCLRARPVELEQKIPLNPLIDALTGPDVARHVRALPEPWRAVVASVLPELPAGMDRPVVPPIAESGLSRRLYDAFTYLLASLAAEEPTLLFIDDLQWADDTTIAVLQFAQRRWRSGALGVIAALRSDLGPTPSGIAKYFEDGKDLPVTTIELRDLGAADATRLIDLVAEEEVDPALSRRLSALGGRNPFYLIELTRDYLSGRLRLPDLPTDAITIPISLRQLLDPRIASLTPGAAAAAEHLSVWGRWVKLSDLAGVTRTDLSTAVHHVEELERYRLVAIERGAVRIAHELFRGAIYHRMSKARRALHHGRVARYLQTTEQHPAGELAIHFARSGEAPAAAEFGRRAADEALEKGAMAEAAYFLQVVTENVADAACKAEATADLARVLHMSREIARANPLLELAARRLRETGNEARALRMDIRRVEGLAEVGATPMPELLDRLHMIKQAARQAEDWEALALALDSELHLLHRVGEVAAIRELFAEIRDCASTGDPAAACLANAALALNILFGDGDEALARAREAVRLAEEHSIKRSMLQALNRLVLVLTSRGMLLLTESQEVIRRAVQLADVSGDLVIKFHLAANQGVAFLDAGDFASAEVAFVRAGALVSEAEADMLRFTNAYNLGELETQRRHFDAARGHFETAASLMHDTTPRSFINLVSAGIGLCALEAGQISEARARESLLDPEIHWHFDPTLIVTFQARMLERRGHHQAALECLQGAAERVRSRFPVSWVKLLIVAGELAARRKLTIDPGELRAAADISRSLQLYLRARPLDQLASRLST